MKIIYAILDSHLITKLNTSSAASVYISTEIILGMDSANERWRYTVTSSLIGWTHTHNDPCIWDLNLVINIHAISRHSAGEKINSSPPGAAYVRH